MPQLEFTIWLSNAFVNWTILAIFFLSLNSPASTFLFSPIASTNAEISNEENNWPWY